MNTAKAELEIKELFDLGLNFNYDFDYNNVNKINAIIKEGYSLKDIISKPKEGEKITFMINDGYTWNGERGEKGKFLYNEKYDGSIYWEHKLYGDWIRVNSDMGSLQKWGKEIQDSFLIK